MIDYLTILMVLVSLAYFILRTHNDTDGWVDLLIMVILGLLVLIHALNRP